MRTTVDLDEDILKVAKHLAQERAQSLGRVLSDLLVRAFNHRPNRKPERALYRRLPANRAQPVTMLAVKDLLQSGV